MPRLGFCIIAIVVLFGRPLQADELLKIAPKYQQTPVWCWATVGEMVFRYFGVTNANPAGNFQCAIVAGLTGVNGPCWSNCGGCVTGAGSMETIASMIEQYPVMAQFATGVSQPVLTASVEDRALDPEDVIEQIDDGQPIIAGISPNHTGQYLGGSEHVALIIGYEGDADDLTLIVNDPFPFNEVGIPDPYKENGGKRIKAGRYKIPYEDFASGLDWAESIVDISD